MAEFTVEFARGQETKKPTYSDGYSNKVMTNCGDDPHPKKIVFNDPLATAEFVVGFDWNNSINGNLPADKLTINSYQDFTIESDLQSGNQTILTNVPPSTLRDSSTGLDLTYPYEILLSDLGNIEMNQSGVELVCPQFDLSRWRYTRVRAISYFLCDVANNCGNNASTNVINENHT